MKFSLMAGTFLKQRRSENLTILMSMETTETETFTAPDILITVPRLPGIRRPDGTAPLPDIIDRPIGMRTDTQEMSGTTAPHRGSDGLHIDLLPYFPEICCFEVVAVQSLRWHRSQGAFIDHARTGVRYTFDNSDGHWDDDGASDTLEYVVREKATEKTAMGVITIQRIAPAHFEAEDIHLMLPIDDMLRDGRMPEPWEIPLGLVNRYDEVEVVEVGMFDQRLFRSVGFSPDRPDSIVLNFERNCNAWHPGRRTEMEYAIRAKVDGEYGIAKGRLSFEAFTRSFHAEMIDIKMNDPLPHEVIIDVRAHNPNFADIGLEHLGSTVAVRGTMEHLGGFLARYVPDSGSGFWESDNAMDAVRYTLRNNLTGQVAHSLIVIAKGGPGEPPGPEPGSGSWDGSGSGGGSGGGSSVDIYSIQDNGGFMEVSYVATDAYGAGWELERWNGSSWEFYGGVYSPSNPYTGDTSYIMAESYATGEYRLKYYDGEGDTVYSNMYLIT